MTFSRGRCLVVKRLCKWLFWQQHLVLDGVPLGLVSGYLGGRLDRVLLFLMDTIYTLPGLLLSVTLAFVVGVGAECRDRYQHLLHPQYYRVVRTPRA